MTRRAACGSEACAATRYRCNIANISSIEPVHAAPPVGFPLSMPGEHSSQSESNETSKFFNTSRWYRTSVKAPGYGARTNSNDNQRDVGSLELCHLERLPSTTLVWLKAPPRSSTFLILLVTSDTNISSVKPSEASFGSSSKQRRASGARRSIRLEAVDSELAAAAATTVGPTVDSAGAGDDDTWHDNDDWLQAAGERDSRSSILDPPVLLVPGYPV